MTHSHIYSVVYIHGSALMGKRTQKRELTHCIGSRILKRTHAHTHARADMHANKHTHAHSHIHAETLLHARKHAGTYTHV